MPETIEVPTNMEKIPNRPLRRPASTRLIYVDTKINFLINNIFISCIDLFVDAISVKKVVNELFGDK